MEMEIKIVYMQISCRHSERSVLHISFLKIPVLTLRSRCLCVHGQGLQRAGCNGRLIILEKNTSGPNIVQWDQNVTKL